MAQILGRKRPYDPSDQQKITEMIKISTTTRQCKRNEINEQERINLIKSTKKYNAGNI